MLLSEHFFLLYQRFTYGEEYSSRNGISATMTCRHVVFEYLRFWTPVLSLIVSILKDFVTFLLSGYLFSTAGPLHLIQIVAVAPIPLELLKFQVHKMRRPAISLGGLHVITAQIKTYLL